MNSAISRIFKFHPLLLLIIPFILFRLPFLTNLPIFNDESIYLDWGWREVHVPGRLFYSLYDGKQPFLMWVFGIFQTLIPDHLYAGRLVSVICGLFTSLGLYKLSLQFLSKKTASFVGLIYIIIPLFVFYDRQALMESSLMTVNVWSCYYSLKLSRSLSYLTASVLGFILGLGYFIKSTGLVFVLLSAMIFFYLLPKDKRGLGTKLFAIVIGVFLMTVSLLIIQPQFWETLDSNSRYVLSIKEVFMQSPYSWVDKFITTSKVLFFGLTPSIVILSGMGMYQLLKHKKEERALVWWMILGLIIQIVFARNSHSRYLVGFLPLICVFVVSAMISLNRISKKITLVVILSFIVPVVLSLYQIVYPYSYLQKVGLGKDEGYVSGQTSGYGITETVNYLKAEIGDTKVAVAVKTNSGNPESAMVVAFQNHGNILAAFLSDEDIPYFRQYDCLRSQIPIYFVTRKDQIGDYNKFFTKIKSIHQPRGSYTIDVHKLKTDCQGKTLEIEPIKT